MILSPVNLFTCGRSQTGIFGSFKNFLSLLLLLFEMCRCIKFTTNKHFQKSLELIRSDVEYFVYVCFQLSLCQNWSADNHTLFETRLELVWFANRAESYSERLNDIWLDRHPGETQSAVFQINCFSCCSFWFHPENVWLSWLGVSCQDCELRARLSVVQEGQQIQDPQRWVHTSGQHFFISLTAEFFFLSIKSCKIRKVTFFSALLHYDVWASS